MEIINNICDDTFNSDAVFFSHMASWTATCHLFFIGEKTEPTLDGETVVLMFFYIASLSCLLLVSQFKFVFLATLISTLNNGIAK